MTCNQVSKNCRIYWNYIQNKPAAGYEGELCFDDNHRCPWWRGRRRTLGENYEPDPNPDEGDTE